MHFDVAREMSVKAVEAALKNDRLVFLTAQKDVYVEEPQEKDLYNIRCCRRNQTNFKNAG